MSKLLLSYPRSGNHLTRFFIELLSENPTFGCPSNPNDVEIYKNTFSENVPFNIKRYNREKCFHKIHAAYGKHNINDELIVLIRNPKETLPRHVVKKGSNVRNFNVHIKQYFNIIDSFINFKGKKKVFFYEDMITNKEMFINQLYQFLNIKNENKRKYVLDNIDKLYQLSGSGESRAWGGNNSHGNINYYFDKITEIEKKNLVSNIKTHMNTSENKTDSFYLKLKQKYDL